MTRYNRTFPSAVLPSRALMLAIVGACAFAQKLPDDGGGTFSRLDRRQQQLVRQWVEEYRAVYKREVDPAAIYDRLPVSARTTFQAVTHALMNSKLTSEDGKPLGTALDLVEVIERFSGQVPDARGDRQFRVYAYLKPGALNKLYAAKEFTRGHDNAVYHIGYPINFRQSGGVPSLQFSVARTGRRADIDVDYRSSAAMKALVSGHLTSANSDVRAGQNQLVHNRRWSGLSNWWRDLMAVLTEKAAPEEPAEGITPGAELERKKVAHGPIHEAVYTYLNDWLIRNRPEELLPLISIKAYPCVAEFDENTRPDSKMALLRILHRMQKRRKDIGEVSRLEDVVTPVSYRLPDSVLVSHPYEKLFTIQEVPDDVAWAIDCRIRYKLQMAESIPRPSHKLNKSFVVSMRVKDPKEPQSFLVQTWRQESGEWRLVSLDIKRKTMSPPADLLANAEPLPPVDSDEAKLSNEMGDLVTAWLMKKQPAEAAKFFLPESYDCDVLSESQSGRSKPDGPPGQENLMAFLGEVAKYAVPNARMEGVIEAVEAGHPDLRALTHERSSSFLMAEISGELLRSGDCKSDVGAARKKPASPVPAGKGMATAFRLVHGEGVDGAVITLYWKKSSDGWRVAAYTVVDD